MCWSFGVTADVPVLCRRNLAWRCAASDGGEERCSWWPDSESQPATTLGRGGFQYDWILVCTA